MLMMQQYPIGENRVIIVKKNDGLLEVVIREKNSNKYASFTSSR